MTTQTGNKVQVLTCTSELLLESTRTILVNYVVDIKLLSEAIYYLLKKGVMKQQETHHRWVPLKVPLPLLLIQMMEV